MKSTARTFGLALIALGGGAVGLGLRILMYATGIDEKGLLIRNHPLDILCWILALALGVLFFVAVRRQEGTCEYGDNFSASVTAALGCFAAAGGSLVLGLQLRNVVADTLSDLWRILALLSAVAFGFTGWCRLKGKRPVFFFHMVICLFFCIHTICNYRIWSSNPQVADYAFPLLACVFLGMIALYRAAFDVEVARPKKVMFASLMAGFLCLFSLVGPEYRIFYLFNGIWAISGILPPFVRSQEAEEKEV